MRDERRRLEAAAGSSDEPLSPAARAELLRLRRQVAEQEKDLARDRECGEETDHPRHVRPAELDDRARVAIGAEDTDGSWHHPGCLLEGVHRRHPWPCLTPRGIGAAVKRKPADSVTSSIVAPTALWTLGRNPCSMRFLR